MSNIIDKSQESSLRDMTRYGGAYPATEAIVRALDNTYVPTPRPATTNVVVKATYNGNENDWSSNTVVVFTPAVEAFVTTLAKDPQVTDIKVGGKTVFTKPVCTGGLDTDALAEAVA